jgi:hypothetical protein
VPIYIHWTTCGRQASRKPAVWLVSGASLFAGTKLRHGLKLWQRWNNISAVILRPTRRSLVNSAARAAVMALPGLLLVYAALASKVIIPAIVGTPLIALAVLMFANAALARLQLESNVLIARSLLGKITVPLNQITRVVPVNLSYRRSVLMPLKRSARMFDVCTSDGPTGIWLNPNVYGDGPIQGLIEAMHIEPDRVAEDRVLDVFSMNRNYGKGRSQ